MAPYVSVFGLLTSLVLALASSRVLELSDKFLELRNEGTWLVMFYAPWCGHCKRLDPIWSHVAQTLHDTEIRVGKVDCTRFTNLATEFGISGFPTIVFLKGNMRFLYRGDRTRDDIVAFTKRMNGPPVKDLTTQTSFSELRQVEPVFFVYVGPKEGEIWDSFSSTAVELQAHSHFCAASDENPVKHEVAVPEIPTVFVYKENVPYFFIDDGAGLVNNSLFDWVNKERFSTFMKITRGNFNQILRTGKYVVIAVLEEDKLGELTPEMIRFKNLVESVIFSKREEYHEYFLFGWIGTPDLANSVAMETLTIPSLLVVNSTSYHHHLPDDDPNEMTAESIHIFLEQILNNTVTVYGGDSLPVRMYRTYYEAKVSLVDMWKGNPVLTAVLFGLPMGFFSLICYSICCADIMDAEEEEEGTEHEKKD